MTIRNRNTYIYQVPLHGTDGELKGYLSELNRLLDKQAVLEKAHQMTSNALSMGIGAVLFITGILIALFLPVFLAGWLTGFLVPFISLYVFIIITAGLVILVFKPKWFSRFVSFSFTLYQRQSEKNE